MRKLWITKLNKYKEVPEYEDLNDLQRQVLDMCESYELAANSNTELCIRMWVFNSNRDSVNDIVEQIRKYPPESITRARRTLTEAELIFPKKETQEKRDEIEKSHHNTELIAKAESSNSKIIKQMACGETLFRMWDGEVPKMTKYNPLTGEKL
jgi:hypothetical protein